MMRDYYLANEKLELRWGFDKIGGFFIQVFDESKDDEYLIVNLDQGQKLKEITLGDGHLSYDDAKVILTKYSAEALNDFEDFMGQNICEKLNGYYFDENRKYSQPQQIETWKDLFHFFDQIEYSYDLTTSYGMTITLTDVFRSIETNSLDNIYWVQKY